MVRTFLVLTLCCAQGDWTCNEPYRYSVKDSPKDVWETCNDIIDDHDEDRCKDLKEEMSVLLVVVGEINFRNPRSNTLTGKLVSGCSYGLHSRIVQVA